jgi:hypothetical protein
MLFSPRALIGVTIDEETDQKGTASPDLLERFHQFRQAECDTVDRRDSVSFPPAIQAKGLLTFVLVGFTSR